MLILWSMFIGAFLAATLLPGGSEILLGGLLTKQPQLWFGLWLAASLGNILGSLTSFYLGRLGRKAYTPEQLAQGRYRHAFALTEKYGAWSLLLSWLPLIGDILCVLAGWLRFPLLPSLIMISIGKSLRYLIVIYLLLESF